VSREKIWNEVFFFSDGLKIAAYLYTPEQWKPDAPARPGIVVLHGYTGMKDVYGLDVPERLWREGYFVLAIDHRGFGTSAGANGRPNPLEQSQDVYDAITYLETVPGIDPDRIGIYGTSWGGGTAIWTTAFDRRIKVVVSAVMVSDGERWLRATRRLYEWSDFEQQVRAAARRRVMTGTAEHIDLADLMITDPHTKAVLAEHHEKHARYTTQFELESAEWCMRWKPQWVAHRIAPRPVLVIYAENDLLVPTDQQIDCFNALGDPKKLVKLPKAQHYEAYKFVNPQLAEIGLAEAARWYQTYL
jgi:pimeloyl-ACP methyl ester carboxylesterase